jgi:hypothetical protein
MAFRTTLALIPVVAWQGYIAHVKGGPGFTQTSYDYQRSGYQYYNVGYFENLAYVDSFAPELGTVSSQLLVKRIARNLGRIPSSFGATVSVDPEWIRSRLRRMNKRFETVQLPIWFAEVPFVALGVLVLLGLVLLGRRGEWLIVLYVAGSVGLICLTPWPRQFIRYLWPLSPVLGIALLTALTTSRQRMSSAPGGLRWIVGIALIATVILAVLSLEVVALYKIYGYKTRAKALYNTESGEQREYRLFFYRKEWQLHDKALDWLEKEANPDEIVATSTPHWVYLKCGLRAVMPPFEADVSGAQRFIDSVPVSYLIVDNLKFVDITRRYAAPIVEAFPERWELIYSSGKEGSQIYRRVTPSGETDHRKTKQTSLPPEPGPEGS